jgi:hypothetical protein
VREFLLLGPFLEKALGFDLEELELQKWVVGRKAAKTREDFFGFLFSVMVNEPTWREWHEDHACSKNNGRHQL